MKWTKLYVKIASLPPLIDAGEWRGKCVWYACDCRTAIIKTLPANYFPRRGDVALFLESGCKRDKLQFTLVRRGEHAKYFLWLHIFKFNNTMEGIPTVLLPPEEWRGRIWLAERIVEVGRKRKKSWREVGVLVVGRPDKMTLLDPLSGEMAVEFKEDGVVVGWGGVDELE